MAYLEPLEQRHWGRWYYTCIYGHDDRIARRFKTEEEYYEHARNDHEEMDKGIMQKTMTARKYTARFEVELEPWQVEKLDRLSRELKLSRINVIRLVLIDALKNNDETSYTP